MPRLPDAMVPLLSPFASLFDARTWRQVQILLTGVILAPGRRTVSTALYALGLQARGDFALFHHVLSRASWSSLDVSRVLPDQLVRHLVPTGPIRLAIDETLERRWGEKIDALGIYRDPVRSSHGHFVKAQGLRWVSLMLRAEVPWARRVWALPFLTVRAPSRHYHEARGRRHKTITDGARQRLCLLRRGRPDRELVVVGDRTYATLRLRAACQHMTPPITFLTRLRLDAVLPDPPPPRPPGQRGRPRIVGARQPSLQAVLTDPATAWIPLRQRGPAGTRRHLQAATGRALRIHPGQPTVALRWRLLRDPTGRRDPQALLGTDPDWSPTAILTAYLQRGPVEVAFQEVRAHLGVETQRQGSAKAIARTTPALLGLSAGSSWSPTPCAGSVSCAPAEPPGMPRPSPPSPTSWPASAIPFGPGSPFFPCPRPPPTSKNAPSRRPHRGWLPSATRPDTLPSSRGPHGLCTKSSSVRVGERPCSCPRVGCRPKWYWRGSGRRD